MLIWIRSQDRKVLAAVDSLDIHYNRVIYVWDDTPDHEIIVLGTYATEERAIEVLDDIQIAIEKQLKVFQMPKE